MRTTADDAYLLHELLIWKATTQKLEIVCMTQDSQGLRVFEAWLCTAIWAELIQRSMGASRASRLAAILGLPSINKRLRQAMLTKRQDDGHDYHQ